jgi:hypothetical protein
MKKGAIKFFMTGGRTALNEREIEEKSALSGTKSIRRFTYKIKNEFLLSHLISYHPEDRQAYLFGYCKQSCFSSSITFLDHPNPFYRMGSGSTLCDEYPDCNLLYR